MYLLATSSLMAVGAALHLLIIAVGAKGYALMGAPAGLVALVGTGSLRPAVSCIIIAGLLLFGSAYGFCAAGIGPRLPLHRLVLTLIATGLIVRGFLLPIMAALRPELLRGICGQCQSVNGFVLLTSALCFVVGCGYLVGARQPMR
jgi:hypothetical protein